MDEFNSRRINILMLEDSAFDAELIERELKRAKLLYSATRVQTESEFRSQLQSLNPDVVLGDYNLPGFDGIAALRIARTMRPQTPFIFVSGSIGEERAVQALQEGAFDYIIKDRPSRLPAAIRHALEQQDERVLRKKTQEDLRRSEERYQFAAKATREVIWDWDVPARRIWFNEALATVWDWVLFDDSVPVEWWEGHIHPEDRQRVLDSLAAALANADRWTAEFRFQRGNDLYGHVFSRAIIIRDDAGNPMRVICAMLDVTEHVVAEIVIRHLSRQNELIVKFAAEGIIANDKNAQPILVNPAAAEMFGSTVQELQGMTGLHAQFHHTRPDGSPYPEEECPLRRTLLDGIVRSGEDLYWRKNGESFPVEYSVSPMFEDQAIVGAVVIFQDVTKRKRLEKQLEQSDRVSQLGRVVATIAHEFNNVLMGIQPFAEVIRRNTPEDKLQNAASQIINSVSRGKRVTQGILRFTQPAEPVTQPVDINAWLQQLAPELRAVIGSRVQLDIGPAARSISCRCDPAQLQQVMANLVINARDAMPNGGAISISISDPSDRRPYPFGVIPQGMVLITVADNGTGMSPELLENVFVPLFTTKKAGTGLGLAVAQQIITRHGGSIHVTSTLGKGTTFYILLPVSEAKVEVADVDTVQRSTNVRRVLLVDDDPVVSAGIEALLEGEGVEVRSIQHGADAVEAVAAFAPDAVILDWSLPDLDGIEVFRRLQQRSPNLPVIFSTGHGDESELQDVINSSRHVMFLRKPYELEALLDALERITAPSVGV